LEFIGCERTAHLQEGHTKTEDIFEVIIDNWFLLNNGWGGIERGHKLIEIFHVTLLKAKLYVS